ncbi:MAG: NAD(P)-dependent alcohol dehydrogenase [Leptospiraceae bacterium]|nr:NAD(P)-dependent alcohol dehydrogenase [Leptospiraceae bacterium]
MRALQQSRWGHDQLQFVEQPEPQPGSGQVRLRLHYAALNYRDWMVVRGKYNPRYPLPLIPGSDGAGVIDAIGPKVTRWKVGDRVMPIISQTWLDGSPDRATLKHTLGGPLPGTLQECMLVPEAALVATPAHLSDREACTLPCAALTAWSALVTYGVDANDPTIAGRRQTVLILGTGGVSIFALQFARLLGMHAIVTSSDDDKLRRAAELGGADTELINYQKHPDWERRVFEITEGRGVDNVIEVGGAGTLQKSIKSVRPGGVIALIGVLAGEGQPDLTRMLMYNVRMQGIFVGHRAGMEKMCAAISEHAMRPVIDQEFAFSESREAIAALAEGKHFGKIVIRMNAESASQS